MKIKIIKSMFPNMWYIVPTVSYYYVVSSHYIFFKWLCFEVGIRFDKDASTCFPNDSE